MAHKVLRRDLLFSTGDAKNVADDQSVGREEVLLEGVGYVGCC